MMIGAMLIFGTIGAVVKSIPFPSSAIALARSVIGTIFLFFVLLFSKGRLSASAIGKNFFKLLLLGTFLGANWILLFEAYRETSVAIATLLYYLAPVFVMLFSPVLGEKLTAKKLSLAGIALLGMALISGTKGEVTPLGLVYGLGAAVLYASIILINKTLKDISSVDTTIAQLGISAIVVGVYVLLTEDISAFSVGGRDITLLITAGVIHTGLAYALYFGAIKHLSAQTSAVYSYIDPVFALILSAIFLKEPMTVTTAIGAILILGSTVLCELTE